jgi:hypothetical protein
MIRSLRATDTFVLHWFRFLFFCEDSLSVGQVGVCESSVTSHQSLCLRLAALYSSFVGPLIFPMLVSESLGGSGSTVLSYANTMCTPKKLLHRQRAFLTALRSDRPVKIRPPTHHASDAKVRDAAEEIFEKYTRLLREPGE